MNLTTAVLITTVVLAVATAIYHEVWSGSPVVVAHQVSPIQYIDDMLNCFGEPEGFCAISLPEE